MLIILKFLKDNKTKVLFIVHLLVTVIFLVLFFYITQKFKPQPISDFKEYWLLADNLESYYKGGLLFILYSPLKAIGLESYICAFIVNSLCFTVLSYLLWIKGKKILQPLSTISLLLAGFWFSGLVSIVNSDIPTIIFFLLGIRMFADNIEKTTSFYQVIAIIFMVIGLTMRSQFLYAFLFLSLFLLLFYFLFFNKKDSFLVKRIIFFVVFSTILAFTLNWGLEQQSQYQYKIELHKRVPFYTGLIETSVTERCGRFNAPAVTLAKKEIKQPLFKLLFKKYKEIPIKRYLQVFTCKWENYFFNYNQSGVGWLRSHLKLNGTKDNFNDFYLYLWDYVEEISVRLLKLIASFLYLLFLYNYKKKTKIEKFVFLWLTYILLFFLAVHTIMEIQPRYLISPILLTIIIMIYLESDYFNLKKIS